MAVSDAVVCHCISTGYQCTGTLMECSRPGNWQDVIDQIWHRASQNNELEQFPECASDVERVQFIFRKKYLGTVDWLKTYFDGCGFSQRKSTEKSRHFRNEGNKLFQKKDFKKALDLYTQSILQSPDQPSIEKALAFGNRSAVLYHQGRYTACLSDIEMALDCGFPESNCHKLYQRMGQCYLKLRKPYLARTEFMKALEILEAQDKPDVTKKTEIHKWIEKTECHNNSSADEQRPPEFGLPIVEHGPNPNLPQASVSLQLKCNPTQGRHLVADRPISVGDTLIVEEPFAAVLLPDHYNTHCHHCFDKLDIVYPCDHCDKVLFCSVLCQRSAWKSYHQFECPYLDILHSIGIAHLALRVILAAGMEVIRETKSKLESEAPSYQQEIAGVNEDGVYHTDYWSVYNLMPHTEDMITDDLFQYALTAALLGNILIKSNFVGVQKNIEICTKETKSAVTDGEDVRNSSKHEISKIKCSVSNIRVEGPSSDSCCLAGEEFDFLCGLLLRHIQQLVCNAHAITELQASDVSNCDTVEDRGQVRVATAIYPAASLMNHSCDPTIISSFYKDVLIVRAVRSVPVGGEIFNCYGPHSKRMCRTERQEALKGQYFFICRCEACEEGEYSDKIFQALRCTACEGPVCMQEDRLLCRHCRKTSDLTEKRDSIDKSQKLFIEGLSLLERANTKGAVSKLRECCRIQTGVLYKHNRDLAQTQDFLARCFAMLGNFSQSAQYLEASIDTTKLIYGDKSIEVGNELSKLAGIYFNGHQVTKALAVIDQAMDIFSTHYGENHPNIIDLKEMKNCLLQVQDN